MKLHTKANPLSSLDLIIGFRAVMETGSLSRAAEKLSLAQPTVRRHIETLEAEIGAVLFTRAQNGLTPTTMAHSLLPIAHAIAAQGDAFKRSASAQAFDTKGTVRLTTSRVIATHVLPYVLQPLLQTHPEIQVELIASDIQQDLLRRDADIAIRLTPPQHQALIALKLPDIAIGLYANTKNNPIRPSDLSYTPFIAEDRGTTISDGLAARGFPKPQNTVLRTDDGLAQIGAIHAGLGTGICQCGIAQRLGLQRVLPELDVAMPCYLVMHEDQCDIARIRLVFDHLRDQLPAALSPPAPDNPKT